MSTPEEQLAKPADVALADDASSLDQDHPLNARLRDGGIGLVPRVHGIDLAAKHATLAAGAIVSMFRVPLGWHCIDDGRRTLIFDAAGTTQINLSLHAHEGPAQRILAEIEQELKAAQPDIILTSIQPLGYHLLIACNLRAGSEELSQTFWPREVEPGRWLMCRVTAPGDAGGKAVDVAGVIMTSLRYGPAMAQDQAEKHP